MSAGIPGSGELADEERGRPRRGFGLLPKVAGLGEDVLYRHGSILPERVMAVLANSHEQYEVYTL